MADKARYRLARLKEELKVQITRDVTRGPGFTLGKVDASAAGDAARDVAFEVRNNLIAASNAAEAACAAVTTAEIADLQTALPEATRLVERAETSLAAARYFVAVLAVGEPR
jgi:hypothetical protein